MQPLIAWLQKCEKVAAAVEEPELGQSALADFRSTLIWEGEFSGPE